MLFILTHISYLCQAIPNPETLFNIQKTQQPNSHCDLPFITAAPTIHENSEQHSRQTTVHKSRWNNTITPPWQLHNPPLTISIATHSLEPKKIKKSHQFQAQTQQQIPNRTTTHSENPKLHRSNTSGFLTQQPTAHGDPTKPPTPLRSESQMEQFSFIARIW
jgi:hypothetical protein